MLPSSSSDVPLPVEYADSNVHLDCALYTAARYHTLLSAQIVAQMRQGRYDSLPCSMPLFQLMRYIRLGVCQHTRTLEQHELPPLLDLLALLPVHMQHGLEQAIEAERRGECYHGTHAEPTVGEVVREWARLTSAGQSQPLQSEGPVPGA